MVSVQIDEVALHLTVEGMDKVWAIKSHLDIPLEHIVGVTVDPPEIHDWWKGLRLAGTQMPGWMIAGTFLYHGDRVFWDVHDPNGAIGIELHDERFSTLIIEVDNPYQVANDISIAIGAPPLQR